MKGFSYTVLILLLLSPLSAITVEEIIEGANRTTLIPNMQGTFQVKMISSNGDVREIEATAYQQLENRNQINRLFLFENPPTVRGTGLLVQSSTDGSDNKMWIYLPAVRRVKRIALESSGGGYFMGSDFTYQDLIRSVEWEGMVHELAGQETINGVDCYVLKSYGEDREKQKKQGYAYTLNYHRVDDLFLYRKEFYDLAGEHLKTYSVIEETKMGQAIYPNKVTMENVQNGHRSEINITDLSNEEIPSRYFTTRYLQDR